VKFFCPLNEANDRIGEASSNGSAQQRASGPERSTPSASTNPTSMPEAYSEAEALNADPSIDTPSRDLPVTARVMHPVGAHGRELVAVTRKGGKPSQTIWSTQASDT
jgi:hypothetical protein